MDLLKLISNRKSVRNYSDKNIQVHKINLLNNTIYDCDKDGTTIYKKTPI